MRAKSRRPRLIPARAGKTRTPRATSSSWRAHPRACGENPISSTSSISWRGSSPRVRGKLPGFSSFPHARGLIPARAGKTSTPTSKPSAPRAHPRACGENAFFLRGMRRLMGSSPRVRGKPGPEGHEHPASRLIPARAGKTSRPPVVRGTRSAHPRACGENIECRPECAPDDGSSPRVRGKRACRPGGRRRRRLIPARAGKTGSTRTPCCTRTAHPRACGENPHVRLPNGRIFGSSPRVRGKQRGVGDQDGGSGLIPARAGKTPLHDGPLRGGRAHPRACGENLTPAGRFVIQGGSSPRVRGKRSKRIS